MAEKYTQWADRSCGVNPFVPGEIALPKQTFGRLLRYGVALLVALPRLTAALGLALMFCAIQVVMNELLMLIVSLGLSWLYNTGHIDVKYFMPLAGFTVINLLSVLPITSLAVVPVLRGWLLRLVLCPIPPLLGVNFTPTWANSARVVGVKVNAEEQKKNEKISPLSVLEGGDVLVSNLTNVLEILFYQCSCSVTPIYVFPICVPAEPKATTVSSSFTYMCHSATFLEALQQSMQYIPFSQRDFSSTSLSLAGESLAVILAEAKRQGRPVVLFVEGVRTNGSGVLEFRSEMFHEMGENVKVHLAGFVYPTASAAAGAVAPQCPAGSALHRLFWLSATLSAPMAVSVNCLIDRCGVPKLAVQGKGSSGSSTSPVSDQRVEAWTQELREVFAKLVNKKTLKLSMIDYDSFYEYYIANMSGNTAESKKISDTRGGKKEK